MKLKPILNSAEVIVLGRRPANDSFPNPTELKVLPKYPRLDNAFYSYNRQLKREKGMCNPIQKAIYNFDFAGNGARGRYKHTKQDLEKVAGNTNIKKKPKKVTDMELDAEAVEEQMQLNFDGTELRGKRVTSADEAKQFIRKFGGVIKRNRGDHFRSGRYSGGKLRREYEASTKRFSSTGQNVEVEDEFTNLQDGMEAEQTGLNIKAGDEGM
tara:strand:+ start:997 stop:1632 length:636 start_codon:yes stop_codon:yes gene_type:complete